MNNAYVAATVLIALLMIANTIHVLTYSGFNKKQKIWFVSTFTSILYCSVAEFAVHCGYYNHNFKILLYILTVLQFSIAPCLAMLFAGALGARKQGIVAFALFGVGLLSEIICVPFGWIFYFNDVGYFRGPAFLIYEIFYILSLIYLLILLIIIGKRFQHRDSGTIIMIIAVLVAGIIPMTVAKIHIAYLAVAIASVLCYIYYNDLVQQDMSTAFIKNQQKISDMQVKIITGLANLIESRDTETGEHVDRTSAYVKTLAEDAKAEKLYPDILNDHYIGLLCTLAPMHDVGKILVSDKILRKPGKLTAEEYEEMKKHASMGGTVVRQVLSDITDEEYLSFASDLAVYHHEWWNGKGYPKGLKGEEIPLSARIMAISDVFDALVSKRCYKEAIPVEEAFEIIKSEAGAHFDPQLVEVFLKHKEKYIEINNSFSDKSSIWD